MLINNATRTNEQKYFFISRSSFKNQFDSEEIGVDLWVVSECVRLMIDGCQEVQKFLPLVATLRSTNKVKITICILEVV